MAFLNLTFDNFEFRDLGHSDFLSFKVLAPAQNFSISFTFDVLFFLISNQYNIPHKQYKGNNSKYNSDLCVF